MKEIKTCPECGGYLQLRKPVGNQSWTQFWGCKNYPNCTYSENSRPKKGDGKLESKIREVETIIDEDRIKAIGRRRQLLKNKVLRFLELNRSPYRFPYVPFLFEEFNPLQKEVLPWVDEDVNLVISASTSSGKTAVSEMIMGRTVREGSKTIYLSPLRALSQQKYNRWTDNEHLFSSYKVVLHTGDVISDSYLKKSLKNADVIIQTSEMLHHKSIHIGDNNDYLFDVGSVIVDEAHLLDEEGRGSELECGLEKFTRINPEARLVLLSATMENIEELSKWLETLNGKKTIKIVSSYRPCKLNIHYIEVVGLKNDYQFNNDQLIIKTIKILNDHFGDKFIVFVQSKAMGYKLLKECEAYDIDAMFHSRDATKKIRNQIEEDFEFGGLDIVIATPTISLGLDLPCRRSIIVGTRRGTEKVKPSAVQQSIGRTGRPSFDKEGDAYILIHDFEFEKEKARLQQPFNVKSSLIKKNNLLFHVLFSIYDGCKTKEDIVKWYRRTLAFIQLDDINNDDLIEVIKALKKMKMIKIDDDGHLKILGLGKICCWFYFNPRDVYGWMLGFLNIVKKRNFSTEALIWALTSCGSSTYDITNKMQFGICEDINFTDKLTFNFEFKNMTKGHLKHATTIYCMMNFDKIPGPLYSESRLWKADIDRIIAAIKCIDSMSGHWKIQSTLNKLALCVNQGVTIEQAELVVFPGIGKKRVQKLFKKGIRTLRDVLKNKKRVRQIIGPVIGSKLIEAVKGKRK